MAAAPNPVAEFLQSEKSEYAKALKDPKNTQVIHFVMGNEAADLDSIVSSIAYAYLLHAENQELYLPLIHIPREDIELRKDALYLFELLGISLDDLLFLSNIPLEQLFNQKRLKLNLVDHNALKPKQIHLSETVESIIDHHADEQKYPAINNKLIEVVGSNATLVAEKIFSSQKVTFSKELATLLLAPILIDTSNLKSKEKTTQKDIEIVKKLQAIAQLPEDFYQKLKSAKNDVLDLTPEMLLNKDFKEYLDGNVLYGISSMPGSVHWDINNLESVSKIIQNFACERNLELYIILMSPDDTEFKRTILIYSPSSERLKAFDTFLKTDEKLKDILIPGHSAEHILFYRSKTHISRKQLQPLIHLDTKK